MTSDGEPGYKKEGADTVIPFSSGDLYYLGRYGKNGKTTIDISLYPKYDKLTVQNFLGYSYVYHCKYVHSQKIGTFEDAHASTATSLSYNPSTGILTFTSPIDHTTGSGDDFSRVKYLQSDLYLFTGNIKSW